MTGADCAIPYLTDDEWSLVEPDPSGKRGGDKRT